MDEGDTVIVTFSASGLTAGSLRSPHTFNRFSGTATEGDDYTGPTFLGAVRWLAATLTPGMLTASQNFPITADSMAEPDETIIINLSVPTTSGTTDTFTPTGLFTFTITIRANDADNRPILTVVTPAADNPAARAERLDAPVAAVGRGVGTLAAEAVMRRLRTAATANQLHLGRASTAEELLRRGGFNLAGGDGGRGFNFGAAAVMCPPRATMTVSIMTVTQARSPSASTPIGATA